MRDMSSSMLNPSAAPFVPSKPVDVPRASGVSVDLPDDPWALSAASEVALSPAELEELETVEEWVSMMAEMEEAESEHCIALALRYADKTKINEIKARATKANRHKKGVQKSRLQSS